MKARSSTARAGGALALPFAHAKACFSNWPSDTYDTFTFLWGLSARTHATRDAACVPSCRKQLEACLQTTFLYGNIDKRLLITEEQAKNKSYRVPLIARASAIPARGDSPG